MEMHLKNCTFRGMSATCHLGKYTTCSHQTPIPFPEYLHHLRETHMMLPSISKSPNIVFESHVLAEVTGT